MTRREGSFQVTQFNIIGGRDGVDIEFANVSLRIEPEDARKIAFHLMEQADRSEREAKAVNG